MSLTNKKLQVTKFKQNIMLIAFFFKNLGVVHHDLGPVGQTVNSAFCIKVLKHLSNTIQHSRPEKWGNNQILHHDNAPCHTSLIVQQFLVMNQIPTTPNHHILEISLCATSGSSRGSGLGIYRKHSTDQDSRSHSKQYQKRTSEGLPAMARPLDQICIHSMAELSGQLCSVLYISFLQQIITEFQILSDPPS
jgi:hypothetical protein